MSNKSGKLFVPLREYDPKEDVLGITVHFNVIHFWEEENGIRFEYQQETVGGSQWDNFSVLVTPKGAITGLGSRRHRDTIEEAYKWYKKSLTNNKYSELIQYWE